MNERKIPDWVPEGYAPSYQSERQQRWDADYLAFCEFWAKRKSKDPSSQVCSIVVDCYNNIVGTGYNGFPPGVKDTPERLHDRDAKYDITIHAEPNALLTAARDLHGATIYTWPFFNCSKCAALVIRAGISRTVAPIWGEPKGDCKFPLALEMYEEAGVIVDLLDFPVDKDRGVLAGFNYRTIVLDEIEPLMVQHMDMLARFPTETPKESAERARARFLENDEQWKNEEALRGR